MRSRRWCRRCWFWRSALAPALSRLTPRAHRPAVNFAVDSVKGAQEQFKVMKHMKGVMSKAQGEVRSALRGVVLAASHGPGVHSVWAAPCVHSRLSAARAGA